MKFKDLNEGETLAANCIVSKSRPPANILWHIGKCTASLFVYKYIEQYVTAKVCSELPALIYCLKDGPNVHSALQNFLVNLTSNQCR
jgi:hypothetical protein